MKINIDLDKPIEEMTQEEIVRAYSHCFQAINNKFQGCYLKPSYTTEKVVSETGMMELRVRPEFSFVIPRNIKYKKT